MNSRERVNALLNRETVDRCPIDLGSTHVSGLHVIAYQNLRKALGLSGSVKCCDVMQQLAMVDDDVLELLHCDIKQISPVSLVDKWEEQELFPNCPALYPEGLDLAMEDDILVLRDDDGARYLKPEKSWYFDAEDINTWYAYPFELNKSNLEALAAVTQKEYEINDYALIANFAGGFGSMAPKFLMEMALEPEKTAEELLKHADELIEFYSKIYEYIGEYTCAVTFYSDYGTQNAPAMSPDMFEELFVPAYKRFTDWLHSETHWKLFLHSCGSVEPLMEHFITAGIDILNPIQISANNMDSQQLKEKYGERIIFWGGGVDTQNILGKVSGDALTEHVKNQVKIFSRDGGFVFNTVHDIQPDVAAEDIIEVYETAYQQLSEK